MTENEEKFLQIIQEKADTLDKRAAQFEDKLYGVEQEVKEIKKTLSYVKHKIGEHDEKIFHLEEDQAHQDSDMLEEIKGDLDFLTDKATKTERDIFYLKRKFDS